jgi:hypothetical protein
MRNACKTWFYSLAHGLFGRRRTALEGNEDALGEIAFKQILDQERSRANRLNLPLSLITLWEAEPQGEKLNIPNLLPEVARCFRQRLRCTDIVGVHSDSKLGILLPHTSAEAAWLVLEDVYAKLTSLYDPDFIAQRLVYRIHTTELSPDRYSSPAQVRKTFPIDESVSLKKASVSISGNLWE